MVNDGMLEYFVLSVFIILFVISIIRRGGLIYPIINSLIVAYSFYENYQSVYFMTLLLVIQYIVVLVIGEGEAD